MHPQVQIYYSKMVYSLVQPWAPAGAANKYQCSLYFKSYNALIVIYCTHVTMYFCQEINPVHFQNFVVLAVVKLCIV